ncbi:hypothetical protein C942_00314 [Photobacterium marinum]|uniref:DUF2787 domain-containing protein n=1 Tax=Photobacterium marinum TaxID=1056511 RepID=L8JCV9_9GAMM|nr:DUF2787 family protein [Photobacterium marinum]ELR66128.1 hypothetical protein C942_00314 [Photobacterium marinum]
MNQVMISNHQTSINSTLSELISTILGGFVIPEDAKRINLNFRQKESSSKNPLQPVEMQLEREQIKAFWQLRFIATFDVINDTPSRSELSLYFNFAHSWFYHPETRQCTLSQPKVQALLNSWVIAFYKHLTTEQLNDLHLKVIDYFE